MIKNFQLLSRKPVYRNLLNSFGIVASSIFLALNIFSFANAAPVTGFKPGKIMDDYIFTNANTMSPSNIQAFLAVKNPYCDTWGNQPSEFGGGTRAQWGVAHGHPAPYTCLKDYSEGGKSAAQIIYDKAQAYSINPQVLIVLLQKEQGLVTDTWPLDTQYRTATGYGCPDTAACDSQYYGLTNQIDWSAKMFRAIMNASPTWYTPYVLGNNLIRWNPSASCGSSQVNIENRATQALYNYTPYQPNQAALNAGYGLGDSCSAYGNRNFYLYYTDWFGSTQYIFGKIPSSASLYARSSCTVSPIDPSYVARLYNPDSRDFLYTSSRVESCLAISYGYIWDGIVMKNATGPDAIPIYRISNPERHIYTSSETVRDNYLNNFGYKDEGISFYAYTSSASDRTPVYGLQQADTFFITSSGREALMYQDSYNFYNFGTMYYTEKISTSPTPVYRISRNNARLYTTNNTEKTNAINLYGFTDEGIISSNDADPNDANVPVYRIRNPVTGGYVYTMSRLERDTAVVNYSHISEGIAFYSLLWSNSPVYRATNYRNLMRIYTNSLPEYQISASKYGYSLESNGWYSY